MRLSLDTKCCTYLLNSGLNEFQDQPILQKLAFITVPEDVHEIVPELLPIEEDKLIVVVPVLEMQKFVVCPLVKLNPPKFQAIPQSFVETSWSVAELLPFPQFDHAETILTCAVMVNDF